MSEGTLKAGQSASQGRVVACMKWGSAFPPDYVNVLYNAVAAHMTGLFEFVCLTNEPEGLHPRIRTIPIPDIGLPPEAWRRGAWPKVTVLKRDIFPTGTRVLFIDLDSMITGPLNPFFETPGDFHAIGAHVWKFRARKKPWLYKPLKKFLKSVKRRIRGETAKVEIPARRRETRAGPILPNTMGTGIFSFDAGAHHGIYETLLEDIPFALANFENEQHFIEHHLGGFIPWPKGDVLSYKYDLRRPVGLDIFLRPPPPPDFVRVLAFHGHPRPLDFATRRISRKEEFPHVWFGPVPWLRKYWEKYNKAA